MQNHRHILWQGTCASKRGRGWSSGGRNGGGEGPWVRALCCRVLLSVEGMVWLQTERSRRTAAGERSDCHLQPRQGPQMWGVVRAHSPLPQGIFRHWRSDTSAETEANTNRQGRSGVNGWCHFKSRTLKSDLIHDVELKAAFPYSILTYTQIARQGF